MATYGFQLISTSSAAGSYGDSGFDENFDGGRDEPIYSLPQNMIGADNIIENLGHRIVSEHVTERDGVPLQARLITERLRQDFYFVGEAWTYFLPYAGYTNLHTFFLARVFNFFPNVGSGSYYKVKWVGNTYKPILQNAEELLYSLKFSIIGLTDVQSVQT